MKNTKKIEYIRGEKELFERNKDEIERLNYQFLKILLLGAVVMCFISSIIILLNEGFVGMVITYWVTTVIFIALFFAHEFMSKRLILPGFYLFFIALLGYSAYSAAVLYPMYTGVISLGAFILMPILILDKTIRSVLIQFALLVIYMIYVIPQKEWIIQQDEIIYNCSFFILGLFLGFYLRRVRLENLELLREAIIRETTDVLTGLYNRRKLFNYFAQCEAGEEEKPITGISILDIDFFKTFNDTYGHLIGDTCLKSVGDCMKEYGKEHNMDFYRYGGEEFVAISHDDDPDKLKENFENVVKQVESLQIPREYGVVTISQGVFFLTKGDLTSEAFSPTPHDKEKEGDHLAGMRFQHFLSKADSALYRAKAEGRNRTEFDNDPPKVVLTKYTM